jgi:hypothetical protein
MLHRAARGHGHLPRWADRVWHCDGRPASRQHRVPGEAAVATTSAAILPPAAADPRQGSSGCTQEGQRSLRNWMRPARFRFNGLWLSERPESARPSRAPGERETYLRNRTNPFRKIDQSRGRPKARMPGTREPAHGRSVIAVLLRPRQFAGVRAGPVTRDERPCALLMF